LKFTLYQKHSNGDGHSGELDKETKLDSHSFGRFRLSATSAAIPLQVDPLTPEQRNRLHQPADKRGPDEEREWFNAFRRSEPSLAGLNAEIDRIYTNWPYAAKTLAFQQRAEPRSTHIFKRGDWQKPLEEVQAGVPAILHPFPEGAPRNRLGFARWIVEHVEPVFHIESENIHRRAPKPKGIAALHR